MQTIQGTEWVDSMETLEEKTKHPKRPKLGISSFAVGTHSKKPSVALVKQALKFLARLKVEERDALRVAFDLIDARAKKK